MNPKISYFGLARIFGGNETSSNTNRVVPVGNLALDLWKVVKGIELLDQALQ
ncbi:hypothetical protein YC2023_018029 [Brassica napus]